VLICAYVGFVWVHILNFQLVTGLSYLGVKRQSVCEIGDYLGDR